MARMDTKINSSGLTVSSITVFVEVQLKFVMSSSNGHL